MTHKWTEGLIKEGQTERWTDTYKWTDRWMDEGTEGLTYKWTDRQEGRETVWINRWTYIQMDRKTREQKDRQADGCKDRRTYITKGQTYKETERPTGR